MPELPEVEVAARNLARWAEGRTLAAVTCSETRALGGGRPAALRALVGRRLARVERTGKNLMLTFSSVSAVEPKRKLRVRPLDPPTLLGVWSHLGMTGKWVRRAAAEPPPRFSRLRLDFDGGVTLYFVDMRLFGFFRLVPKAAFMRVPEIAALGPDPLRDGIDAKRLVARLAARRRLPVKVAIMDQALIPGVGNIQASEGLHRAGLDPRRPASSLGPPEVRALARGLMASFRYTLRRFAVEHAVAADDGDDGADRAADKDIAYVEEPGTRNPFKVYDRAGARCARCRRGIITRLVQAGRSTYFCPKCQR